MAKNNTQSKTKAKKADIIDTTVSDIAEKPVRLPAGALDDIFVEYYLETASNTEAYERACKAGGKDFKKKYAAQYGKAMFDRLKERINDELISADVADKALGRKVMRELTKTAQSESVKGQMASNLAKGLYPDVLVEKAGQTYEEILAEGIELDRQLQEQKTH
jgi:hypothetical protein